MADTFAEQAAELIADSFPDWEVEDEVTLICPCGNTIEWDGDCDECGPSPLKRLGLI